MSGLLLSKGELVLEFFLDKPKENFKELAQKFDTLANSACLRSLSCLLLLHPKYIWNQNQVTSSKVHFGAVRKQSFDPFVYCQHMPCRLRAGPPFKKMKFLLLPLQAQSVLWTGYKYLLAGPLEYWFLPTERVSKRGSKVSIEVFAL